MEKQSRRAFVQTIFGVTGAAAVLATLPTSVLEAASRYEPLNSPEWLTTYEGVLAEARRRFEAQWAQVAPPYRLLEAYQGHAGMTTQINAGVRTTSEMMADGNPVIAVPRFMESMALLADQDGISIFSPMQIPRAVQFAKASGPVRMVVCWDVNIDSYITRFDVLGKSTRERHKRYPDNETQWASFGQAFQPVSNWAFK